MRIEIFYDVVCPYVWRAAHWLDRLQRRGVDLEVVWRPFSLAQVNNREEGWVVWKLPIEEPESWGSRRTRGLRGAWATLAAARQGREAHDRYLLALLDAVHEDRLSLDDDGATRHAAERADIELSRWERESRDPSLLDEIAASHASAREREIFGTPTFVFPDGALAYLKLSDIPEGDDVLRYWESFSAVSYGQPLVLEIKRPH